VSLQRFRIRRAFGPPNPPFFLCVFRRTQGRKRLNLFFFFSPPTSPFRVRSDMHCQDPQYFPPLFSLLEFCQDCLADRPPPPSFLPEQGTRIAPKFSLFSSCGVKVTIDRCLTICLTPFRTLTPWLGTDCSLSPRKWSLVARLRKNPPSPPFPPFPLRDRGDVRKAVSELRGAFQIFLFSSREIRER